MHEFSSLGSVRGNDYHESEVLSDKEALEKADKIGKKIACLVKSCKV